MQVLITGKNIDLTDALKTYTQEKFGALEKFYDKIIRADVVLTKESHQKKGDIFVCECKLEIPGNDAFVRKDEQNMYKAIDKVSDHLAEELKKHKNKTRTHREKTRGERREQKSYKI